MESKRQLDADAEDWGELLDISALLRQICTRILTVPNHQNVLTAQQVRVLELVHHFPDGVTATFLGRLLKLTSGSTSQLVDRLEKLGVLKRVRSNRDRREVRIQLSPQGVEHENAMHAALNGWIQTVLHDCSPAERKHNLEFLNRLRLAALNSLEKPPRQKTEK